MITNRLNAIIIEVRRERFRQDKKWGEQNHNVVEWIAILGEEFGEAAKEAVDFHFANGLPPKEEMTGEHKKIQYKRIQNYRKECIEVAAVAISMVESLDRQLNKV